MPGVPAAAGGADLCRLNLAGGLPAVPGPATAQPAACSRRAPTLPAAALLGAAAARVTHVRRSAQDRCRQPTEVNGHFSGPGCGPRTANKELRGPGRAPPLSPCSPGD